MTKSLLWREFESGDGLPLKALRFAVISFAILVLIFTGTLDLTWPQQAVLSLLMVPLAIWMDRSSTSYLVTLTLMLLSMYSTFRYGFWRIATTARFFADPGTRAVPLDYFFICLLIAAETYAFVILFLGYLQTLWPLRRTPVPLPENLSQWPAVDVLIPTYNEPLSVVRYTALAALHIDWPAEKLHVYILDDGNREDFRRFAAQAGVGYIARDDNRDAKAGNINHALTLVGSPFVAVFDSDHVPTRSFLQVTMGWFLRDRRLAMLQTPHHFYSPDPFERNLSQFRSIPNEGELFYGIVQDGNDFWNATFFCGSCAVIRRKALDHVGGVAVETVTEDAHTSLRMQQRGWNTAYVNIPQAAGLATERLSNHVRQRIRWARGMIQILRIENPLFARGLSIAQRLCYFNAMTHFLYALPRLIFLTAPLIYLILGKTNVPGYWAAVLAYAFPHLALSSLTNSRVQGQHRHTFWNEIYETVLAPYTLLPTLLALVNPRLGKFNVTPKGSVLQRSFFDTRIAWPFLVMLTFNLIGILMAVPRYWHIRLPLLNGLWDGTHVGTIGMNVVWAVFNSTILSVATAVAWESQQRRKTVRVQMNVPADVVKADGTVFRGASADLSTGGARINLHRSMTAQPGEAIRLVFPVLNGDASLPARVVSAEGRSLQAQFESLTLQEEEALTMVLYSRADTWLGWGETRENDHPLRSVGRILSIALQGLRIIGHGLLSMRGPRRRAAAPAAAPLWAIALLVGCLVHAGSATQAQAARSQQAHLTSNAAADAAAPMPEAGSFHSAFTLAEAGVPEAIDLRGTEAHQSVAFGLASTRLARSAVLHLRYRFSPGLVPEVSHLRASLNGVVFATLPATHAAGYPTFEATLPMPVEVLKPRNVLSFAFAARSVAACEDPASPTLWSQVDAGSSIEIDGSMISQQNDLGMLPHPFFNADVDLRPTVNLVFVGQPSAKALRAAGIVASHFGVLAAGRPMRFTVSVGTIPDGNAIVLGENAADLPATLNVGGTSGPTIAMRTNPGDPYGKLLVLTGDKADDLVTAAEVLALENDMLGGDQQPVRLTRRPAPRQADDAPRWMSTDPEHVAHLGDVAAAESLQGDGTGALNAYMRLPPDLYYQPRQNLSLHLAYRYNAIPLADDSSLAVRMNSMYAGATPLPHSSKASAAVEAVVPVPVSAMRPFSNTLSMKFDFDAGHKSGCEGAPPSVEGAVLPNSWLDLRDIPHWHQMPDLQVFSNAGYPFTRMADLSETAVVLPDVPTTDEMELYLALMGHFGAQTGYPAINVAVTDRAGMKSDRTRDYLVLGTVDDQPALAALNPLLPVKVHGGGLSVEDTQGFFSALAHAWWKVRSSDRIDSGQLETANGLPDALIEGLEWPAGSGRSVVLIALRDHSVAPGFVNAFFKYAQSSDIDQSVSVLHGSSFSSYRIGNDMYHVGSLSSLVRIHMLFSQFPWMMVLLVVMVCLPVASVARVQLRRHARQRLKGSA